MLHTFVVTRVARAVAIGLVLSCLAAGIATLIAEPERSLGQEREPPTVLDLTADVPSSQQGYPGIPGMSGGGGWRPGPTDTVRYGLPLTAEILDASPDKDGNFVFELLLRNTGNVPFGLPSFRNLTTIEKPGNKARRVFFFQVQPVGGGTHEGQTVGSAATGGSTSIPGSIIRLDPGKSMRVLLLASSNLLRRSFKQESEKLGVRIICAEWKLDDNRFFLNGISTQLESVNTINFVVRDGNPAPVKP